MGTDDNPVFVSEVNYFVIPTHFSLHPNEYDRV
jgi:hypothetical protein